MFPIVQDMVDRMCEEAKTEIKTMNQYEIGSWSRAVTSADGAWMTRGHHSKNFTFSIRNFYTGALLYRKHLCQKGRDTLINEELYQGTSKGAEGYAARLTFKKAKEEGINIAIHWQDADSSSSNAMTEHFPDAEVMICGGHAGKAHKKQLEELAKKKSFTDKYKNKHREKFPQVDSVVCHCEKRHTPGCGCLSAAFIEKARNNFSFILSNSESAHDFAEALKVLPRHACDEHKWDGGKCTFHELKVCSCGKCEDDADLKCDGKDYHTRQILKCPMHSLAYEIECHQRASKSEQLVHPILKRGHSNWLEASHNVFIRFRPKHIHLDRLHYILSTELALLQSNMTYMYRKRGPQYHWVVELFRRLKLPVYDGVHRALEEFNNLRMEKLEHEKTEKSKKRRIMLKVERTKDAQRRKEWSRKHGHDTYGDDEDSDTAELKPKEKTKSKKGQKMVEGQCKCGSTTHLRTSHSECPYNKKRKNDAPPLPHRDDDASQPHSDLSQDDMSFAGDISSDESDSTSNDDWCYEDDIISSDMCVCGALGRAHKRDCPMSSRSGLPTEVYSTDSQLSQSDSLWGAVGKSKSNLSTSGKRKSQEIDKHPTKKKRVSTSFEVGNYVSLHSSSLVSQHVPCRIVRKCRKGYQLYCKKGILDRTYSNECNLY